jgi:hypothetical protein
MNNLWQAFTPDETDEVITQSFIRRWGIAPQLIIRERTLALAGPVPDPLNDADSDPRTDPDWGDWEVLGA